MEDALKPQTSVEQLALTVGEHGYARTTPAHSKLQLLL